MRRFALLALLLPVSACGYQTWWNPPFTGGYDPNEPVGQAENMDRAKGLDLSVAPINPQPGDLWPGPPPPIPTLRDIEQSGELSPGVEQPVPGSPNQRMGAPSPNPTAGSSVPAPAPQPGVTAPPMQPNQSGSISTPPARNEAGRPVATPNGVGVTTGGTSNYQTMTVPGGGTAIVVPNGNGTSTVIKPDGSIETIPTPK